MLQISEVLQFVVPCWLINMSLNGIYIAKLRYPKLVDFDKSLDGGKVLPDGHRIFGNSTTLLGVGVALVSGLVIQFVLTKNLEQGFALGLSLGIIYGLVVYCGHALGSFVKRRFNYLDGQFMPFVDHGDYIITAGIVLGLMQQFSWTVIAVGIVITYMLHPVATYLAYLLKWHKYPL